MAFLRVWFVRLQESEVSAADRASLDALLGAVRDKKHCVASMLEELPKADNG